MITYITKLFHFVKLSAKVSAILDEYIFLNYQTNWNEIYKKYFLCSCMFCGMLRNP